MPTRIRRVEWAGQPYQGKALVDAQWRWLSIGDHQCNLGTGAHIPPTIVSGSRWPVTGPGGISPTMNGASSINSIGDLGWRKDWTVFALASPVAGSTVLPCIMQAGTDAAAFGFNILNP